MKAVGIFILFLAVLSVVYEISAGSDHFVASGVWTLEKLIKPLHRTPGKNSPAGGVWRV